MKEQGEPREFQFLATFLQFWSHLPKEEVWEYEERELTVLKIAFEVQGLCVVVCAVIGPRGGLSEELYIVDPNAEVEIDRLVCNKRTSVGNHGKFLPLWEMREAGRKGGNRRQICRRQLVKALQIVRINPGVDWKHAFGIYAGDSDCFRPLQGGLPGQGKRA